MGSPCCVFNGVSGSWCQGLRRLSGVLVEISGFWLPAEGGLGFRVLGFRVSGFRA